MVTADGPGTVSIGMSAAAATRTNRIPGSEITGMPASETRATLCPFRKRSTNSRALWASLNSW